MEQRPINGKTIVFAASVVDDASNGGRVAMLFRAVLFVILWCSPNLGLQRWGKVNTYKLHAAIYGWQPKR